ncbi:hypothetical protein AVEN_170356-1 [Araneus ventricosus]|uniref:Uncharacterized protein n=1 Tax=Araneus ventricosus TaxID=182803 RepID=A0A4Y2CBX5_ARAVE|nr:hypothetical protein AVEN_170356-1 [Araneus ventricosus]
MFLAYQLKQTSCISFFISTFSPKPSTSPSPACFRPRWPSGKVSASGPESFHVGNPIPLNIRRVLGLFRAKSYVGVKRPPSGVALKFGEGVPAQVSSLPSDRGSQLRGPSQNSPRVASKRDVNIPKLNFLYCT